MIIKKVKEQAPVDNPHKVDVRPLYNHENAQVSVITLKPGESLKPHITPVDVFFYILEGITTVMVGEETVDVEKNSLVESPKGIVHCLSNKTNAETKIIVVKSPRPRENSKIL